MPDKVSCNNRKCQFNTPDNGCTAETADYIDDGCITYRSKSKDEDYEAMMRPSFRSGCHKTGTGYKADHGRTIK